VQQSLIGGAVDLSREELAAVRGYVAEVMSATLAGTVLYALAPQTFSADMTALYREVFSH